MHGWNQNNQMAGNVQADRIMGGGANFMMGGGSQMMRGSAPMMARGNPMLSGGGMMMGQGQMMYQTPYPQQGMFQQPIGNSYNMNQMNNMAPQHAPLPGNAPNLPRQPPPPAPSDPPPPLPNDDKRTSSQPPPPPPESAGEWWKSEIENLQGSSKQELMRLTKMQWFLAMSTNQQIECWQHKLQLKSKPGKGQSVTSPSAVPSSTHAIPSSTRAIPSSTRAIPSSTHAIPSSTHAIPSSTHAIPSSTQTTASGKHTNPGTIQAGPKLATLSAPNPQDVPPDWNKSSGENPHVALKRFEEQLDKLNKQREVFEKQYNDWRGQFEDWKRKHQNHPNQTQFVQYEKQWMTWQEQMLGQKKQNEAGKERLLGNIKKIKEAIEDEQKQPRMQQTPVHRPGQMFGNMQRNFPSEVPQQNNQRPAWNDQPYPANNRNQILNQPRMMGPVKGQRFPTSNQNLRQPRPQAMFGNEENNHEHMPQDQFNNAPDPLIEQEEPEQQAGNSQEQPLMFHESQPRMAYPRPRIPGHNHLQPRFPGSGQLRPRLPGVRPRMSGGHQFRAPRPELEDQSYTDEYSDSHQDNMIDEGKQNFVRHPRPRFPGTNQPRQRFPRNSLQRPRMPGNQQQRPRFPGGPRPRGRMLAPRQRFPGSQPKDFAPLGSKHPSHENWVDDEDYEEQFAAEDRNLETAPFKTKFYNELGIEETTEEKDDNDSVYVDGEDIESYLKHKTGPPAPVNKPMQPARPVGNQIRPRFPGSHAQRPRFPSASQTQPKNVKINDYGNSCVVIDDDNAEGENDWNSRDHGEMPLDVRDSARYGGLLPRRHLEDDRPPWSRQYGFDERRSREHDDESQHFPYKEALGPHHAPRERLQDKSSDRPDGNINIREAQRLAEGNPMFSGENLKKLQEQLKAIKSTTGQEKSAGNDASADSLMRDEPPPKPVDPNILEKARSISSIDLRNILSAVRSATTAKPTDNKSSTGIQEERSASGRRGSAAQYPDDTIPPSVGGGGQDPLLEALEQLAAVGGLEDDMILEEYLKMDPVLEQELFSRAMQDKELLKEARIYDPLVGEPGDLRSGRTAHLDFGRYERDDIQYRDIRGSIPPRNELQRRDSWNDRIGAGSYSREIDEKRYSSSERFYQPAARDAATNEKRSDLRDGNQRVLEREALDRGHEELNRDFLSLRQQRESLDAVWKIDAREEERRRRERSLERLQTRESELRDRERDIRTREQKLREALRQFSPSRKRYFDDDRRRDETYHTRERGASPHDRFRDRDYGPSRGRDDNDRHDLLPRDAMPRDREISFGRDNRDRLKRRSPSPRRDDFRQRYRNEFDEYADRNRTRSPMRRSPPRKFRRSQTPPSRKDEFGRDVANRGRDLTRGHAPSPRRMEAEKKPPKVDSPIPPLGRSMAKKPSLPREDSKKPSTALTEKEEPAKQVPLSINIEDIINMPGRLKRPPKIVVILRGLPGSGKTHIAKMIRDKESTFGVSPRVLGLDDYFISEVEKTVKDPETGKSTKKRVFEYEYEDDMEPSYRGNLIRSFKKTLEDGYFTFVIMDAINDKLKYFEECYKAAKTSGFQGYVSEIRADVHVCARRNVHNRELADIQKLAAGWEETPAYMNKLDLRQLIQDSAIQEVEMGDITDSDEEEERKKKKQAEEEKQTASSQEGVPKSKWENESAAAQLDKLDGITKKKKTPKQSMEEFLSVTDDYNARKSAPGKKRVRWADINEKQNQQRMREVGFVVGQTDWSRMMDDSHARDALNRTKFI